MTKNPSPTMTTITITGATTSAIDGSMIVTAKMLAAIVNLTPQRLGQLTAEGMPRDGSGGYPLGASVRWLLEYWRQRAQQTPLNAARRRKIKADAQRSELDLAELQRTLAPIAVLAQAHGEACTRIRTRLRAIPAAAAPLVHRADTVGAVRAIIQAEIDRGLQDLADAARAALARGTE